jgi:hypothetical protein
VTSASGAVATAAVNINVTGTTSTAPPVAPPPVTPPASTSPTSLGTFRYIKINTTEDAGWVAWREIEVYGPNGKLQVVTSTVGPVPSYLLTVSPTDPYYASYYSHFTPQGYASTPSMAYDGDITTDWNGAFTSYNTSPSMCHIIPTAPPGNSGLYAYQDWITLDLGSAQPISKVRMTIEGSMTAPTCGIHQILGSTDGTNFTLIKTFSGNFYALQWLQYPADSQNPEVGAQLPSDGASFVSMSVPPTVSRGQQFTATVVMKNTGQSTWVPGTSLPFHLGSQVPMDNQTWGLNRTALSVSSVPPGGTATFTFTATAPATAGSYTFAWRMVQEAVQWFGDTAQQTITVQ